MAGVFNIAEEERFTHLGRQTGIGGKRRAGGGVPQEVSYILCLSKFGVLEISFLVLPTFLYCVQSFYLFKKKILIMIDKKK